jgi:dTDP-4-dehydrorhamnose reductase
VKILLFGKGGQVGWELQRALAPLGELVALGRDSTELRGDSPPEALAATVRAVRPTVIVNAVAHGCGQRPSEPELARALNATAPGVLAREAAAFGATLVHYSTDYVFDGSGSRPRAEQAPTGPLSVYGRTKLEGEQAIQTSGCRHLILRTSWVYAARGGNFAKTMLRLAAEREQLKVIDDQIGAPTGAELLADATAHALRTMAQRPDVGGLYHLVADGDTSWHGYARFVIEWARAHGHTIKVADDQVLPIPTSAYPTPAARPLNSRLDTARFRHDFGLHLPPWQTGVTRMLREVLER